MKPKNHKVSNLLCLCVFVFQTFQSNLRDMTFMMPLPMPQGPLCPDLPPKVVVVMSAGLRSPILSASSMAWKHHFTYSGLVPTFVRPRCSLAMEFQALVLPCLASMRTMHVFTSWIDKARLTMAVARAISRRDQAKLQENAVAVRPACAA